ncbi:hypothetical protein [Roseibium sediminicola]|uniref:Tail assembly chaperone n=1 Tax=Roseibium sediminicola TaxID=2933272 RepID=A0ABT0H0H4_9HYPH|nr:hypothetical protein [Roseibium sp. CAU 1639]MCK7615179.1 hypothetical protein [Roseibium sp. CAU 1639]
MAVRLGKTNLVPGAVKFPDGIWVTMRRANSSDLEDAEAEAGKLIAGLIEGAETLSEFGLGESEGNDFSDLEQAFGKSQFLTLAMVFERVVSDWSGVLDEDGHPAPLSRLYIGRFLLDPIYRGEFRKSAYARLYEVISEGNGSAASPTG